MIGNGAAVHTTATTYYREKSPRYDHTDYYSAHGPYVTTGSKDILLNGTAGENKGNKFNFYIFDSYSEYSNWYYGRTYSAIHEVKDIITEPFSISLTEDEAASTIYFAVENPTLDIEETITLSATISWIGKSSRYDCTQYYHSTGISIFKEAKDIILDGTVTEMSNNMFNFYIMNSSNYCNWYDGEPYTAYYEAKDISTITFSVSLTRSQATSSIYFVVENPNMDIDEVVNLSAIRNWVESSSYSRAPAYFTRWGIIFEDKGDWIERSFRAFVLEGTAREVDNNKFNFYIFDSANYSRWTHGKSYTSYYEARNVTGTPFSLPLTLDEAQSKMYFVAENPLVDTSETIEISATLEYQRKETHLADVLGIVGILVMFLGAIMFINWVRVQYKEMKRTGAII